MVLPAIIPIVTVYLKKIQSFVIYNFYYVEPSQINKS
jgi:hypothetical protein